MLKSQIALIAILIASVAFVSCDRAQQMLDPVVVDDMRTDMKKILDAGTYTSWAHAALPAPTMTVAEAAEAGNAAGTGAAHNPGSDVFTSRTVYINEMGAMANKAGTAYPAGTIIFKAIMDETETFVDKVAMMMKSDDEMYTGHGGWRYEKYARPSEDGEYMQVRGSNLEDAGNGCHGCHAKADNDSVFVSLSMDEMMDDTVEDDMMDDDTAMDDTMEDDMMDGDMHDMDGDADTGDGNGTEAAANGGDANGDTNGAAANGGDANTDAGNGNGNGDGDGDTQ